MMRSRWLWALGVTSSACVSLWACGGDDSGTTPTDMDAGSDASPGIDAGRDATMGVDAAPDAPTGNDAASEAAPPGEGGATDGAADAPQDVQNDVGRTLDGGACQGGTFAVTSVAPVFAWTGGTTALTITGTGFDPTPKVYLRDASGTLTQLTHAAYVSTTSISAIVPKGIAAGSYDVGVVNPDACAEFGPKLTVVANAPPVVDNVSPGTGTTQGATSVTITGCHFASNATVSTLASATASPIAQTAGTVVCDAGKQCSDGTALCTMTGASLTLSNVGAYAVRVTDPAPYDATDVWGDWYTFVVTDPSGKLSPPTGGQPNANGLTTGRRSLGVTSGRVNSANRFLYAVGGEDASGVALSSIEVGPLDPYGQLGKWFVQKNALKTPRSGLALVRQGAYLYALGGTESTNGTGGATPSGSPLDSIERAMILDPSGAPVLQDPPSTSGSGTLAQGTWYYEVSAVLNASDPNNAGGETLASDEVVATLSAAGSVTLTWAPVANAAYYRVYRSPTANTFSATEVLLKDNVGANVDGGNVTYTDTGADTPGTEKPMPLGSTGTWQTLSGKLAHPRMNAAATIAPDPSGALHVYVAGGYGTGCGTGVLNCYELASIDATGATLGAFAADAAHTFLFPRMRQGLAAMTAANGPSDFVANMGANGAILVMGGGPGLGNTGNSVEYAVVGAGGVVNGWANPSGFANERDGTEVAIANGYSYAFLGGTASAGAQPAKYDQTSGLSTTPSFPLLDGGGHGLSYGSWSNAGANLASSLGRHGLGVESAYFYIVGGTSDDKDALTTVYQILD